MKIGPQALPVSSRRNCYWAAMTFFNDAEAKQFHDAGIVGEQITKDHS